MFRHTAPGHEGDADRLHHDSPDWPNKPYLSFRRVRPRARWLGGDFRSVTAGGHSSEAGKHQADRVLLRIESNSRRRSTAQLWEADVSPDTSLVDASIPLSTHQIRNTDYEAFVEEGEYGDGSLWDTHARVRSSCETMDERADQGWVATGIPAGRAVSVARICYYEARRTATGST